GFGRMDGGDDRLRPNEWARYYGQGCAATFWTDYWAQEGEEYVQYPVLVDEEASFRTSGFSTLAVHQRNSPVGIFELAGFGPLNFSSFSAYFLEVIKIYVPGGPGDYWVEVDWGLGRLPDTAEFAFWQVSRLDGNELLLSAVLDINGGYVPYPHPLNQDLTFSIERVRLFDQRTKALLTGYYYTAGPEPGVMVGGTLWTPEPATAGLAAGSLLLLIGWRRFRAN
ncbi:MAG: hypothetical protein NTZ56_20690, partial [Acidobacteria bacterium]|nr:hypothetical protein [Acidobacteriota bacterium]